MKVLVTGAGGQVGRELDRVFADHGHEVVALTHAELDVGDRGAVQQAVGAARPDAVVHAAALTDVDACELDPDRAYRVNALGTRHVAEAARRAGAHLCHLSTDYVFSGVFSGVFGAAGPRPYVEWDGTDPLSVYGRSKLGGERELGPEVTVVRTSWVFGRSGANFVKAVLRLAGERDELAFVDDQQGCPTAADDLAGMIHRLVSARLPGLFHVTNQGATSRFALARDVLTAAGLDPQRVRPISTAELVPARPAPRPAWSVLDNAALRLQGIPLLPDHHEPLERLVKELTT